MATNYFGRMWRDEDGAVTVDFVVLTAALVTLGVLAVSAATRGTSEVSSGVGAALTASASTIEQFRIE